MDYSSNNTQLRNIITISAIEPQLVAAVVQRNAERGAVGPGDAALHGLAVGEVG